MNTSAWIAALVDAVMILVFVTIGRSSHAEGVTFAGVVSTAWPFLAGAAIGWGAVRAWTNPRAVVPTGVAVWACAVGVGMILRVVVGQGTAAAFIGVATGFLGATMLGWRLAAAGYRALVARRARARGHV